MSGEAEHLLHPRPAADQLRAILEGAEHADGGEIAALARVVLAECDDLRGRIGNARAEIARQDVAATNAMRPGSGDVCDALAAVETHLVDPEYRPDAAPAGLPEESITEVGFDRTLAEGVPVRITTEPSALDRDETRQWQWAECVSWNAPDTVIVPISLPAANGDVDAELVMDTAQAALLGEMLTDAAKGGVR